MKQLVRLGGIVARTLAWTLLGAATALAQGNVLVVAKTAGPGVDFTDVQAAVDAAAGGDVLLIHAGTYAPVTVDGKSLSLIANEGGSVKFPLAVRNLSAAQSLLARGIAATPPLSIENNAGDVLIEDGTFESVATLAAATPGASIASCASVAFVRCSFRGSAGSFDGSTQFLQGGDGVTATGSFLHFFECTLTGGAGGGTPVSGPDPGDGGNGATLSGCSFFASGTAFEGGNGGTSGVPNPSCPFTPGDGGDGLVTTGIVTLERFQLGSTFQGGVAGTALGFPCGAAQDGNPVSGTVVTLAGTPRTLFAASPVREGELSTSTYVGQPGDLVFGIWGVQQDHVFYSVFEGTTIPRVLAAVLLGTIPATGTLSFGLPLGDLPPGVDSLSLYSQAVILPSSAPLLLTNATGVVILDSSF